GQPASPVLPDRPPAPVEAEEHVQAEAQLAPDVEAPPAPPVAEAVPEVAVAPEPVLEVVAPPKPRLRDRLGKARSAIAGAVGSVRTRERIDDETWDDLEEALIRADVGVGLTSTLLDDLRTRVKA